MTRSAALSCPESVTISRDQWERIRKLGAAAAGIAVDLMFMANETTGRVVTGTASQTISALGCGSGTFYALVDAGLVKVRPRRDVYLVQPSGSSVPKKGAECVESVQIATTTTSFVSLSGREEEVQEKKGPACAPKKRLEHTEAVHSAPVPVEPTPEMRKLAKQFFDLVPGATLEQVAGAIAQGTRFLPEEFRSMLPWLVREAAGATVDAHAAQKIRDGVPWRYFKGVLSRKAADMRGLRIMAERVQEEATPAGESAPRPKQDDGRLPMAKEWGQGSYRPGPRWTNGRKPEGHYDYANVNFQRGGPRPSNVFLQREKHDAAYYDHIYKRFDDEPNQKATAQ